jgi:hypothetical protein
MTNGEWRVANDECGEVYCELFKSKNAFCDSSKNFDLHAFIRHSPFAIRHSPLATRH